MNFRFVGFILSFSNVKNRTRMLFYFCYSCLVFLQISAEVITLIKDNVVTCVLTNKSVLTSTLYITNSIDNIFVNRGRNNIVSEWYDSDWQKGYSHTDVYGHVPHLDGSVYSYYISSKYTYLNGSSFDNFFMWILVDPYCYLDITLESEDGTFKKKGVTGPIDLNSTPNWQQIVIYHHNVKRLHFMRKRYDQRLQGLWVVNDIRGYHAREIHKEVMKNDASKYVCKIDSALEVNLKLCPAPHCNIQCSEILGPQYQHCESHKICLESDCHCAWGYEGTTCKQLCQKGHWGLDCLQKCDEGCENCHHITGVCTKCKDKFVGATCSEELPVVLQPPEVLDVRDNQTLIGIHLEYGRDESMPQYFLIQYRELNKTESFRDYTQKKTYDSSYKTMYLDEIVRNHSYEFRVVLIYRNRYFESRVPTLKLYKASLHDSFDFIGNIVLNWTGYSSLSTDYDVTYRCTHRFCLNSNIVEGKMKNKTGRKLSEILPPFSTCYFQLLTKMGQLVDSTYLQQKETDVLPQELPRRITLSRNALHIELENCAKFSGPLAYHITYECLSTWYLEESQTTNYTLEKYKELITVTLNLIPFTLYNVTIVGKRYNQADNSRSFLNISTPPDAPLPVENCSIYNKQDDTISIRCNNPYPPRGKTEKLKIRVQTGASTVLTESKSFESCKLWDDYTCVNISATNEETFNITIGSKNYNVSQWGKMSTFILDEKAESSAPENLQVGSYNSTSFILTWDHPVYTYQKIENFLIQIAHSEDTHDIRLDISEYQKNYEQKIPLSVCRNCTITVSPKNNFTSHNVSISVLVSKPIDELSNKFVVWWCSKSCYVLVPNMLKTVAVENEGKSSLKDCFQWKKFYWKCELEDNSSFVLVVNGSKVKVDFSEDQSAEVTSRLVFIIIGIVFVVIISSVMGIGLWYYKYKYKKTSLAEDADGVVVRNSIYGYVD